MGSFTPNLNLYEPSVGETGWGTAVNTNFTTLDEALTNPTPTATGTLTAEGLVDISGVGAGQIKFPATQNPSANVNTLDDYKEGTWTPSVGGTATYSAQLGTYTKIGRMVHVTCRLQITLIGTGSTGLVSGLPFTSHSNVYYSTGAVFFTGLSSNMVTVVAIVSPGTTTIGLVSTAAASPNMSSNAILGNSTSVYFSLTYITD